MAKITLGLIMALSLAGAAFAQDAAAGKTVFASKCVVCHGADGAGKTSIGKSLNIKDLHSAEVQKMSDADLKSAITNGKNKMPPFKGKISEVQLNDVVAYVRQLGK
jgi:cytochrome c6